LQVVSLDIVMVYFIKIKSGITRYRNGVFYQNKIWNYPLCVPYDTACQQGFAVVGEIHSRISTRYIVATGITYTRV